MRQMSLWAHTAGTDDEGKMTAMVSTIADDKGMSRQLLAKAVGGLIEKGVDWQEASAYAGQIADLIDGQGMEAETIATLINSFKEAGVKKEDMAGMLGQVAAAGDIGAFGPKDMARYLPSMLGNIKRLGMEGPEAVRFLGASLQSQYSQTQDSAAAAIQVIVQGDVKDPAQLARELQPYIAQQQREITQQLESRKLYDDAHL